MGDVARMVAGQFLSDAERDRLSRFPRDVSAEDVATYFTLTPRDLKLVRRARGDSNRLGLALTVGTLRFLGFVPKDLSRAPRRAFARVASQLGVSPDVPLYPGRAQTRTTHLQHAAAHLGFRKPTKEDRKELQRWLVEQASAHARPTVLLAWAAEWHLRRHLVRPGLTVLERAVIKARRVAENRTAVALSAVIKPNRALLDGVIAPRPSEAKTVLAWLRERERTNSPRAICRVLDRLAWLRKAGVGRWDVTAVHPNRRRYLARLGATANPQMLRRMPPRRRYPALAAYLTQALIHLTDEVLEMFERCLGEYMAEAKRLALERRGQNESSRDDVIAAFRIVARLVMAPQVSNNGLRREIFREVPPRRMNQLLQACFDDARPADDHALQLLARKYKQLRPLSRRLMAEVPFHCTARGRAVMRAVDTLRSMASRRGNLHPDSPTTFVPTRWRPLVLVEGGLDRTYYELCMLWQLRDALRNGSVWVEHSRRFGRVLNDPMLTGTEPVVPVEDLGVAKSPQAALFAKANSLNELEAAFAESIDVGASQIRGGRVVVSPHRAASIPASLAELEAAVSRQLPRVDLSSVLVEVDRWTGFSQALAHAAEGHAPTGKVYLHTMAAIMAQACNLGLSRMAEASQATFANLAWANAWHLSESTLKSAFTTIVNYHHKLPLSAVWGGGALSSSDGQRFPVRGRFAAARPLPRYFGFGRGITYYTWTSDQFSQYGTKFIPVTSRDATYVLDEIMDNETELDVVEHTTDTAGYTDLVFALFDLLGLRFAPRIRDSGSAVLYRLQDAPFRCEALRGAQTVRRRTIEEHWPDMLRVAALLKGGHLTASLLVSRLQASRETGLSRALIAYGRLCKTEHLLRYFATEAYRRRIGRQLNKGEALHALRRFLVFGNQARLRPRDSDELTNQAACLNLVVNAVIVWNTVYMQRVLDRRRKQGLEVRSEDVARLSPARFEHINPYGRYRFDPPTKDGSLRRLRP